MVHSFYRSDQPSGENIAVRQQVEAMRRSGFDVVEVFRYTDEELRKPLFGLRSAARAVTGLDFGGAMASLDWKTIDVINVHNTLPNFGTRWLSNTGVPLVTTVHNFRFTCANGLLFRNGQPCTECLGSRQVSAIKHGCYQESRVKTIPVAVGSGLRGAMFPVFKASRVVVAQTPRVASALRDWGMPKTRIELIPGFVEDLNSVVKPGPKRPRFIFVGRPTPEKGLVELLEEWPSHLALDVVGCDSSPIRDGYPLKGVQFKGPQDRDVLRSRLSDYTALVFPGRVYEGALPLVVREALEAGVPVVARSGSSAADFVRDTGAGFAYRDGGLALALDSATDAGANVRQAAREVFQSKCAEAPWLNGITRAFTSALSGRAPH